MSSDIVFIDTYSCPQCRAELETRFNEWQGWQRCPACGLPSLPPEPSHFRGQLRLGASPTAGDDVLVISDKPDNLMAGDPEGTAREGQSSHVSGGRLILRTGLVVSAGLAFIFFLDHRTTNTVIFASLSFAFLSLLLRNSRRRASTP